MNLSRAPQPAEAASPAPALPGRRRIDLTPWQWKLCGFLLMATALSYLDRQALSVVAPVVAGELKLDNEQLGRLLSAFFYTYAAMHIAVGWILDRYNIRYTYGLFVALWSCSQILAGFARGFGDLFVCRLFLGAFETAGQTGAARIIARTLPPRERTFANGLMMSGGSIGAMLAPLLMIFLANRYGWRFGFIVLGALGLLWAAAWLWWFRPAASVAQGTSNRATLTEADQFRVILRNPRFWACVAGAACTIPILHISASWVPTYLVQEWGLKVSGALSGYLFLVYAGLDIGFIGGGAAVSWLISRGWTVARARVRIMWISAVLMMTAALVPFAPAVGFAVAGICLLNVGRACWGALFLAFNQDIAPGRVGLVAGVMGCLGSLMGAWLVWLIGWVTKTRGFDGPFWMIAVLVLAGTIPVATARWEDTKQEASKNI
jgi:sugar phosphate permease